MDRVVINGTSYAAPFRHLFRPHTPAERADLADDVRRNGIQYPVLVATTPGRGRLVIDGLTRAEIATGFNMEVLVAEVGDVTDEWAESRARALNVHRRHLTPDERAAEVVRLRALGNSVRSISRITGIPRSTVADALAGVRTRTPDEEDGGDDPPEPERVTGLDGRNYPATRPAPVVAFKVPASLEMDAAELELAKLRKHLERARESGNFLLTGPLAGAFRGAAAKMGLPVLEGDWAGMAKAIKLLDGVTQAD